MTDVERADRLACRCRTDGPVLGALGFRFERGHRFTDAERAFAMTLADHCAHALERARLYDAERRSREALAVLASIGEHLARSLDPDAALRTLAELVVPAVADQCVVDLVRGAAIERRALVHADPALQEAARTLERFAPDIASDTPVAVAIREGETQLVPVTQELPDSAYRSDEHRAAVKAIELRSMLTAPARGARTHARRAHVRLEARARVRRARTSSSPSSSRGASRSRSTTARSTRRRTASASGSARWSASCRWAS